MKTFAFIALSAFVIFLLTATYLLVGGEKPHVIQPVRRANPLHDAAKSQPPGWSVTVTNVPPEKEQELKRAIEEVMREDRAKEPVK